MVARKSQRVGGGSREQSKRLGIAALTLLLLTTAGVACGQSFEAGPSNGGAGSGAGGNAFNGTFPVQVNQGVDGCHSSAASTIDGGTLSASVVMTQSGNNVFATFDGYAGQIFGALVGTAPLVGTVTGATAKLEANGNAKIPTPYMGCTLKFDATMQVSPTGNSLAGTITFTSVWPDAGAFCRLPSCSDGFNITPPSP